MLYVTFGIKYTCLQLFFAGFLKEFHTLFLILRFGFLQAQIDNLKDHVCRLSNTLIYSQQ